MLIDYHNFFESAPVIKATRLIVRDDLGNAISLFLDNVDNTITCYSAGDPEFIDILKKYGIEPPVIKTLNIGR